jgi:RNA polymerase sigma-70 factor (ECF subfamily)
MNDLHRLAQQVVEKLAGLTLYARQWLDAASADDVVQEALTALLAERHPPDDPIPWMFRAVRNAAIDQIRSSSRRRKREETIAQLRREWFESNLESAIDAQTAEQALRQLPDENRQIIILRIWGGLGYAQIAQIVELSTSVVYERYKSSLLQLRSELEKSCRNKTD